MTHIAVLVALAALVIATVGTPQAYLVAGAVFLAAILLPGVTYRPAETAQDARIDALIAAWRDEEATR